MARKILILVLLMSISLSGVAVVKADGPDTGYKWNDHVGKFNFTFDNLIDNHQQMQLLKNGALQGFIYIQFTGEYIDGIPVAQRADCTDSALDCRVGWEVIGAPVMGAKLIQRGPRLWELDPASMPADPDFVHFSHPVFRPAAAQQRRETLLPKTEKAQKASTLRWISLKPQYAKPLLHL